MPKDSVTEDVAEIDVQSSMLPTPYIPGTDWGELANEADTVSGADLASNETLDALVGVPFLITRLVFRPGKGGHMVSVECVIPPEDVLRKRRVNLDTLPFEPSSQVVFNDGSTGIYRQCVQYVEAKGYIGKLDHDKPENAPRGESRYDVSATGFKINAGNLTTKDDSFAYDIPVRLYCPRGIRISDYQYEGDGSKTRYIA